MRKEKPYGQSGASCVRKRRRQLIMEVKDRYRLDFSYIEAVETDDAERACRKAAEAGADIIIAYGLQTAKAQRP